MRRDSPITFTALVLWLCSCQQAEKLELPEHNTFVVESEQEGAFIDFKIPKRYLSFDEYLDDKDSVEGIFAYFDQRMEMQPWTYFFFDSLDSLNYISIASGPRVLITDQPPKVTYFAQPSVRHYEVFPQEDSTRSIVYQWKNIEYRDKTYYKTKYKVLIDGKEIYQSIYFIVTDHQSCLVEVLDKQDLNLDTLVLNMEIMLRPS